MRVIIADPRRFGNVGSATPASGARSCAARTTAARSSVPVVRAMRASCGNER
jgi:hypothetical protein